MLTVVPLSEKIDYEAHENMKYEASHEGWKVDYFRSTMKITEPYY